MLRTISVFAPLHEFPGLFTAAAYGVYRVPGNPGVIPLSRVRSDLEATLSCLLGSDSLTVTCLFQPTGGHITIHRAISAAETVSTESLIKCTSLLNFVYPLCHSVSFARYG